MLLRLIHRAIYCSIRSVVGRSDRAFDNESLRRYFNSSISSIWSIEADGRHKKIMPPINKTPITSEIYLFIRDFLMKYERKNSDNIAYLQAKIIIGQYCVVQDGGFLAKNYYFCE